MEPGGIDRLHGPGASASNTKAARHNWTPDQVWTLISLLERDENRIILFGKVEKSEVSTHILLDTRSALITTYPILPEHQQG